VKMNSNNLQLKGEGSFSVVRKKQRNLAKLRRSVSGLFAFSMGGGDLWCWKLNLSSAAFQRNLNKKRRVIGEDGIEMTKHGTKKLPKKKERENAAASSQWEREVKLCRIK